MNCSDFFKSSKQLCRFSRDGTKFANATLNKIVIRDVENMKTVKVFRFESEVQHLEWSADSTMILCANFKKSLIRIWLLQDPEWKCVIDEGFSGLVDVRWSPDSRYILSTGDFHLRITVWSLVNKTISYIQHPKNCSKYIDFTSDGRYLAVAERRDHYDHISIFNCSSWSSFCHFSPATVDLCGISWSPTQDILCTWDSFHCFKVLLYKSDGQLLSTFNASGLTLGVKSVIWSPSGQILAIGSFSEKLHLLNHLTWGLVDEFQHDEMSIDEVPIYKEIVEANNWKGSSHHRVLPSQNFQLPIRKLEAPNSSPECGIGKIVFSFDSKYVASVSDLMPSCVWIWNVMSLKCCGLIVQNRPIKDLSWDPVRPRLAVCTGSSDVLIWMPEGVLTVPMPRKDGESLSVVKVMWWPLDGSRLALIGSGQMCWFSTLPDQCQVLYSPAPAGC